MSAPGDPAAIEATRLHFHYPDGTPGLGSIDIRIGRGERWGIAGPNGSGKSTLLHHFAGVHAAEGHLEVLGIGATPRRLPEIRRRVGFLFQDPDDQLFLPTVAEDVAFGPRHLGLPEAEVEQRVSASLARLRIEHLAGRACHHLSGGEKQSAAIAGVLALDPEILILDEPSNDLDAGARRRLIEFLRAWDRTLVVATHDLELLLETVEWLLLLDRGCRVAAGPAAELLADGPLLERHGLEVPPSLRARPELGRDPSPDPREPPGEGF